MSEGREFQPSEEGQEAGERTAELTSLGEISENGSTEAIFLVEHSHEETLSALEQAKNDPNFAASYIDELGPEGFSRLVQAYDQIEDDDTAKEGLVALAEALGSAGRAEGGPIDEKFLQDMLSDGFHKQEGLDPELAAILLGHGDYTPEAAAQLGAYVLLNDDPPALEPLETFPSHRRDLLTQPGDNNVGAVAHRRPSHLG